MPNPVIQALSPLTIQKIAAGEVVERPANAVKELVENALDAGASKITVQIEDGGKELIRVSDNGRGMTREDVLRCWLPHTTSKLKEVEDLDSVASFGFRGEALASLAAVSELTIESRHWEETLGTRLRVVESRPEATEEMARSQGTTLSARNLFRNNPVRRKFLGSGKSEASRISSLLNRLSLAHPGVSFRLTEGEREILHLPEGTLRRRVADVLGAHVLADLLEVDWEEGGIRVHGFISEPQRFSSRSSQHFFVNRRWVQSGLLSRALNQAYEVALPGRQPLAALFLSLSPAAVDVNVHPTKREVRFLHEAGIFWALSQALQRTLRKAIAAPSLELAAGPESSAENHLPGDFPTAFALGPETEGTSTAVSESITVPMFAGTTAPSHSTAGISEGATVPYLQIHHSYILVAVQSGFMLVNQRAAHERILYEKALEGIQSQGSRFAAQQLLFPELVELSPGRAKVLENNLTEMRLLGFDLEPFGASTFQLRGLPAEVEPRQAQAVLQQLVEGLSDREEGRVGNASEPVQARLAKAFAKAAAIRLGEPLDSARMAALVDGLFATRNPYVSPGGAPVLIRYSLEEIHRRFGLSPAAISG